MKVVVFGAGNNWNTERELIEKRYEVTGIIDNAYELKENVRPVSDVFEFEYEKILITPYFYQEMYQQLVEMGIDENRILIWTVEREILVAERKTCGLKCYGQHFDDLIIAAIFGQIGVEKPSYLDLGANYPFIISNTALLYENGCRGVAVEANPIMAKRYHTERPKDIMVNKGVGIEKGILPFYKFDDFSGLNTFDKSEAKRYETIGNKIMEVVELPIVPLRTIIDDYCGGIFPDFLDCDVEGFDYDVLESFDMTYNGPKVACVEVRVQDIKKFDELFSKYGYFKFCRMCANNIYVRNEYRKHLLQME